MTRRWLVLVCALLAFPAGVATLQAQQTAAKRVVILTTGGTIASRSGSPMASGESLVTAVPQLLEHADVRVEEFSRIGSSQMTPANWLDLAKRINRLFGEDPELTGVVITHGTDTMEETAFFLNLTVRDRRPVVLVGSMRTSTEISPDGPANLLNGVRVAVADGAIGKGVLVALNENISAARDVWKTDNRRVDTFRSPELGFLGFADPDTVVFYREPLRPHTAESEFDVSALDELPRVALVSDYAGFDGAYLETLAEERPAGIVLATFAGGRMSAGARRGAASAIAAGVPIVVASRVPGGRIVGNPVAQLGAAVARDLPPHKARILLMLALTSDRDLSELQRIFDIY